MPDLTVEVIEKLSTMIPPTILEIGDHSYSTNRIYLVETPSASSLPVFSLNSVVGYVNTNPDRIKDTSRILINVRDYNSICVYGILNQGKKRDQYLEAVIKNGLRLNQYLQVEDFILMMMSDFKDDEMQQLLLKIASDITDEYIRTNKDDGVTQRVTVKSGIARREAIDLPNPVKLVPFRTFPEIEQPEGLFVFRAQKGPSGPMLGLFDCDTNEWKARTIEKIKSYLLDNIKNEALII